MISCRVLSDVEQIRHKICIDKDKTMLWSGARYPFGLFHQDGSPKLWKKQDFDYGRCKETEVGRPVIVDNYYGEEINGFIASENGKETLDQALERLEIELPKYDKSDVNSVECWETVSQYWAENAQGEVGLSCGETIQENSLFTKIEFDIIKANLRVTSIVVYDNYPVSAGGEKSKVFMRNEFEKMRPHELCLYWRAETGEKRHRMITTTSKQLKTISPTTGFVYGGQHWIKLADIIDNGTLAITAGLVVKLQFDENNYSDWCKSSLRTQLNDAKRTGGFLASLLDEGASIDDFIPITSNLVADDGMTEYGTADDYIALLSCDLYRQYRAVIPPVDDWYWTLTTWTCIPDYSNVVRCICSSGVFSADFAHQKDGGIRPICCLEFDTWVSC